MTNPKPAEWPGLVVVLLGFWLAGCSGTPFGDQLAERLSEPDLSGPEEAVEQASAPQLMVDTTVVVDPTVGGEPLPEPDTKSSQLESPIASLHGAMGPHGSTTIQPSAPVSSGEPTFPEGHAQDHPPLNPTPYRLVLHLPAADPAAPAEAVTRALRDAGILFEVETIERLPQVVTPELSTPLAPSP